MSIGEKLSRIWQIGKVIYATLALATIAGLVVLLLAYAEQQQRDLSQSLTITIIILVASILSAASLATIVQELFARTSRQNPRPYGADLGSVFERYVKWFSYVIGPVIVSYGVVRIITALQ